MQSHFCILQYSDKMVKNKFQKKSTFAMRFLYGKCSSLRFR